jgi:hypothetical protein
VASADDLAMTMLLGHARQRLCYLTHQFVIFRGVARSLVSFLPTLRQLLFGHTVFDSVNPKTNQAKSNEKHLQCLLNTNPAESMFAARVQAITDAIGQVWPFEALRVVALLSKPGCKQQQYHRDFDRSTRTRARARFRASSRSRPTRALCLAADLLSSMSAKSACSSATPCTLTPAT